MAVDADDRVIERTNDLTGETAPTVDAATGPARVRRRWRRGGRLDIQSKLLIMLLLTSVISCLVVGFVGYRSGRDSLRDAAFESLREIRESRSREITRQYEQTRDSLVIYTRGSTAIDAVQAFQDGFHELEESSIDAEQEEQLETYYEDVFVAGLNRNQATTFEVDGFLPTSAEQRYLQAYYTAPYDEFDAALAVDDAGDGSAWSAAHAQYHDYFRELVLRFDYEDALLIDNEGDVVYTAYKGVDLGTSLRAGPFASTSLAAAFEEAIGSNAVDFVGIRDFERYQPSDGVPTSWVVSAIGENGVVSGVLALQIGTTATNEVMTGGEDWESEGLGETGETYLAGPDELMRSPSRLLIEDGDAYVDAAIEGGTPPDVAQRAARVGGTVLLQPVRTEAVQAALRGQTGEAVTREYLGRESLVAYAPLEFEGLQWVIVAKIDADEAFEPVDDFTRQLVLSTIAMIVAVCVAALLLAQLFSRPIRRLMTGVHRVAAGELGAEVATRSGDEFGDLGQAFNDMSRSLRIKQDLLEDQQRENERLLLTLMPENVAKRYRQGEETIAQDHPDVSVVFADLVGFEEYAATLPSDQSLAALNGLVRSFDEAAVRTGVDRVRTLRHGYLASCGLVSRRVDHVRRTVDFTLEMQQVVDRFNATTGAQVGLRAGIDTGAASSGLVGRSNVAFDMWGDAVNLAYRVQGSDPTPGVFVTARVYDRLRDSVDFVEAGQIEVQSGPQQVWRLAGSVS